MNRRTLSYFTTFFVQGTRTEERQGRVKKEPLKATL